MPQLLAPHPPPLLLETPFYFQIEREGKISYFVIGYVRERIELVLSWLMAIPFSSIPFFIWVTNGANSRSASFPEPTVLKTKLIMARLCFQNKHMPLKRLWLLREKHDDGNVVMYELSTRAS